MRWSLCCQRRKERSQHFLEPRRNALVALVVRVNGVGHVNGFEGQAAKHIRHVEDVLVSGEAGKVFLVPVPQGCAANANPHEAGR